MKRTFLALTILVAALSFPLARAYYESSRAAENALKASDSKLKIAALRETLRWHFPGNPFIERARRELQAIAADSSNSENQGAAQEALRTSAFETRSALNRLPESMTEELRNSRWRTTVPFEPNYWAQFLSHIFFWGWVLSSLACIYRSFTTEGRLITREFLRRMPLALLLFLSWAIALHYA